MALVFLVHIVHSAQRGDQYRHATECSYLRGENASRKRSRAPTPTSPLTLFVRTTTPSTLARPLSTFPLHPANRPTEFRGIPMPRTDGYRSRQLIFIYLGKICAMSNGFFVLFLRYRAHTAISPPMKYHSAKQQARRYILCCSELCNKSVTIIRLWPGTFARANIISMLKRENR